MAGILDGLGRFASDSSGSLVGLGLGIMSGDMGQASAGYMQGQSQDNQRRLIQRKEQEEEQKRVAAQGLAQKYGFDPNIASADPDAAIGIAKALEVQRRTPKELSVEQQQWQMLSPEQRQQAAQQKYTGGGTEYGLSPVYGTDANGKPVIVQLGKNGSARQTPLPDGFSVARDPIKVEGPTGTTILDPQTRQMVGFVPKDNRGAEREKNIGEAEGKAIAGAESQSNAADVALSVTKQIREHPRLNAAVGSVDGRTPTLRGDTQGFVDLVDQAKSGAFLTAVQNLKGLGAMSEYEAKSATSAIVRMNRATDEKSFLKAVDDYEAIIKTAKQKAQNLQRQRGGGQPSAAPSRMKFDASGNLAQ